MKDKEKQICKHYDEEVCSRLNCKKDCKYYGKANCKTCIHEDICQLRIYGYCEEEVKEKGCKHYQPKLSKDSVVLSKEEYKKLKMLEEGHITCEDVYEFVEKSRKETAEKFLNMIYWKAVKHIKGKNKDECFIEISFEKLDEIAKQFGVEIKE